MRGPHRLTRCTAEMRGDCTRVQSHVPTDLPHVWPPRRRSPAPGYMFSIRATLVYLFINIILDFSVISPLSPSLQQFYGYDPQGLELAKMKPIYTISISLVANRSRSGRLGHWIRGGTYPIWIRQLGLRWAHITSFQTATAH